MARTRRAFNGTDTPVVIGSDGAQIDGGDWGKVDAEDELVLAALRSGRLSLATEQDPGEPDGQPTDEQVAAAEATLAGNAPPPTAKQRGPRAGGS